MTSPPPVRVKVCGITRLEDAELAVRLGADAIGFVLWERSPRYIAPAVAAAIAAKLPPFVARTAVVVNLPPDQAEAAARAAGCDVVQLHGDESAAAYRSTGRPVIKAMAVDTPQDVAAALALPPDVTVLVDAADPARRGGTGRQADWTRAAEVARRRPVILAGGLTAGNVTDAIRCVRPWAIDVSSGVESAPGIKSQVQMEKFFAAVQPFRILNSEFRITGERS